MRYEIHYTIGNGYLCRCCSHSESATKVFDLYSKAVEFAADVERHHRSEKSYDSVVVIPENPDDFFEVGETEGGETMWDIDFDEEEFERQFKLLAEELKKGEEDRRRVAMRRELKAAKKLALEYERLKNEFEG